MLLHITHSFRLFLAFAACYGAVSIGLPLTVKGQTVDSLKYLSYADFYGLVVENHPFVRMADLEVDYAKYDLMVARGNFDPKLTSGFDRKSLNGKDYYNKWKTDLKIPVWGGIDAKIGHEDDYGDNLSPELTPGVSNYAGVALPLGRGFFMEERRNTLKQAEIYQQMAAAERQKTLNKIVYSAAKAYWDWYLAYQKMNYIAEGWILAQERFDFTKSQVTIGEKAGIDSVEAKITFQSRYINFKNAEVDYRNATATLSTYLWDPQKQPLELTDNVVPQPVPSEYISESQVQALLDGLSRQHPELVKLSGKSSQLAVEEKYRKEFLKPVFDVEFAVLQVPKYNLSDVGVFKSNHKIGVNFEMPLYLRKERGKLQQVKIKQLQVENERQQLQRDIRANVRNAYTALTNYARLVTQQNEVVANQTLLLLAEREKFQIGESSLFLLNSREDKLIDQQIKAEELKAKYEKALAELLFAAGQNSLP